MCRRWSPVKKIRRWHYFDEKVKGKLKGKGEFKFHIVFYLIFKEIYKYIAAIKDIFWINLTYIYECVSFNVFVLHLILYSSDNMLKGKDLFLSQLAIKLKLIWYPYR